MNPAMWTAKTGVQAQDAQLDAIANNLANANTVGFKADRVVFNDLPYQVEQQPGQQLASGGNAPLGTQVGTGTRVVGTQKVFTNGSLQQTSQPLDLAIVGQGFFQVQQANGELAYTRAGQFQVDSQGHVVTAQGLPLQPQLTIPTNATAITISQTGLVSATVPGQTQPQQVGQIALANFVNPAGLTALGDNLFQETTGSGNPVTGNPGESAFGTITQGSLESSNVQVVEQMVDMIAAQRTYEMNTKVLSASDNMMQMLDGAVRT